MGKQTWTEEEKRFLVDNYPNMANETIARLLKKSLSAIESMAQKKMKLKKSLPVKVGDIFNKFTVLELCSTKTSKFGGYIICRCECGTIKKYKTSIIKKGERKGCSNCIKGALRHGKTGTRIYRIWQNMLNRCRNKNNPKNNPYYAERNIDVCKEWGVFEVFESWALNNGYRDGLSIDRKENFKGYCPENCRWATTKEQANNKTDSKHVLAFGEKKTVSQWAEDDRCQISRNTLRSRLNDSWEPEKAILTPLLRKRRLKE